MCLLQHLQLSLKSETQVTLLSVLRNFLVKAPPIKSCLSLVDCVCPCVCLQRLHVTGCSNHVSYAAVRDNSDCFNTGQV